MWMSFQFYLEWTTKKRERKWCWLPRNVDTVKLWVQVKVAHTMLEISCCPPRDERTRDRGSCLQRWRSCSTRWWRSSPRYTGARIKVIADTPSQHIGTEDWRVKTRGDGVWSRVSQSLEVGPLCACLVRSIELRKQSVTHPFSENSRPECFCN